MITPELIAEIRAALDAATPEPDTALVCLLRNHAPELLDEIERLQSKINDMAIRYAARVAELEADKESSRRADVAINQALNEGDGSYRP